MSLQLERRDIELCGKTYTLVCNMAALDELQEAFGGTLDGVREATVAESSLTLLSIMLNRWAVKQGWSERWTPEQLKDELNFAMLAELDVLGMMFRAMAVDRAPAAADPAQQETAAKN